MKSISDFALLRGEHNPNKYLDRVINYPSLKLIRYNGSELNPRLRNTFDKMGLYDLSEAYEYYAIMRGPEILASGTEPISMDVDDHHFEISSSGIFFDDNQLDYGENIGLVLFDGYYTNYEIKQLDYSWGLLWDSDYDFDYNHK